MDQGGGLQCLARLFSGQLRGGELPQLVVDQRQQLLGGSCVAGFDLSENSSNVFHYLRFEKATWRGSSTASSLSSRRSRDT